MVTWGQSGHWELREQNSNIRHSGIQSEQTAGVQQFKLCNIKMLQESEVSQSQELTQNHGAQSLDGVVFLSSGAEGRAPQGVQAVDQDQCASQVLPAFGDGVLHLVQAHVQLLDHIPVAVANLGSPRHQEVIGWLPHGLQTQNTFNLRPSKLKENSVNVFHSQPNTI